MFQNMFKRLKGLESFRYGCGGDMIGGSHATEVSILDDERVLVTFSKSEGWWQDAEITEYAVDRKLLEEIEALFHKYHMKSWSQKALDQVMVCDGSTESYAFDFPEDRIHFSSQMFPKAYAQKVKTLHDTINTYVKDAVALPGYRTELLTPEEAQERNKPQDGVVRLCVVDYAKKRVRFRILNGTNDEIEIPKQFAVYDVKSGDLLGEKKSNYTLNVGPNESDENGLTLEKLLEAGTYRLEVGTYQVEFHIE